MLYHLLDGVCLILVGVLPPFNLSFYLMSILHCLLFLFITFTPLSVPFGNFSRGMWLCLFKNIFSFSSQEMSAKFLLVCLCFFLIHCLDSPALSTTTCQLDKKPRLYFESRYRMYDCFDCTDVSLTILKSSLTWPQEGSKDSGRHLRVEDLILYLFEWRFTE